MTGLIVIGCVVAYLVIGGVIGGCLVRWLDFEPFVVAYQAGLVWPATLIILLAYAIMRPFVQLIGGKR